MREAGIVVGWNRARPARRVGSTDLLRAALAFCERRVQRGELESFEPVLLSVKEGFLDGFLLLRGDVEKLEVLSHDDEFLRLLVESNVVMENFGLDTAYVGDGLTYIVDHTHVVRGWPRRKDPASGAG